MHYGDSNRLRAGLKNRSSRGNEALISAKTAGSQDSLSLVTSAATTNMGFLRSPQQGTAVLLGLLFLLGLNIPIRAIQSDTNTLLLLHFETNLVGVAGEMPTS